MSQHVHAASTTCFLDCPGWRLPCGHLLDECHPHCPRWGGMDAEQARALGQDALARTTARESACTGDAA